MYPFPGTRVLIVSYKLVSSQLVCVKRLIQKQCETVISCTWYPVAGTYPLLREPPPLSLLVFHWPHIKRFWEFAVVTVCKNHYNQKMRAAMTTSNLAATQLFKTNRKQRTEEDLPSFVNTGRTVVGGRRNSSVMSNFAMHGMDAQHLLAQARLHRLPSNDPNQLPYASSHTIVTEKVCSIRSRKFVSVSTLFVSVLTL